MFLLLVSDGFRTRVGRTYCNSRVNADCIFHDIGVPIFSYENFQMANLQMVPATPAVRREPVVEQHGVTAAGHRTVVGASLYTGLSTSTLAKLRHFGHGPPYLKLGARVLYRTRDLDDWMGGKVRRSTAEVVRGGVGNR